MNDWTGVNVGQSWQELDNISAHTALGVTRLLAEKLQQMASANPGKIQKGYKNNPVLAASSYIYKLIVNKLYRGFLIKTLVTKDSRHSFEIIPSMSITK